MPHHRPSRRNSAGRLDGAGVVPFLRRHRRGRVFLSGRTWASGNRGLEPRQPFGFPWRQLLRSRPPRRVHLVRLPGGQIRRGRRIHLPAKTTASAAATSASATTSGLGTGLLRGGCRCHGSGRGLIGLSACRSAKPFA